MSEVILTIRLKLKLIGLTGFLESEKRAEEVVLEALSTSDRIQEVKFVRTDMVKADGPAPKLEVRNDNR